MSGTVVYRCINKCKHEFQDSRYGPGMRLMNVKSGKDAGYSCTVCSTHNK